MTAPHHVHVLKVLVLRVAPLRDGKPFSVGRLVEGPQMAGSSFEGECERLLLPAIHQKPRFLTEALCR